ncbi:MAG: DNA polymerase III subunit alpha [Christensenellales bacterium]
MFTHLHLHTQYSLLDGACMIPKLLDTIRDMGMDACAITDHGVMYGVVEFYQEALKRNIHPVIGCEVYVCPDMDEKTSVAREYSHLVLLCENQTGYQNLTKLVSEGFIRGFYYKPRVDYALLRKYSEGLIALSACLSGDVPKLLSEGRRRDAREMAETYRDIFGKDNFFIEIQDHGLREEKQVLPQLVRLARETGIPLVATNDCHYIHREDALSQEVLMCIQTGKTLSDDMRMRMESDQLYVKSEEEMRQLFPELEDAIENTNKIAKRCNVTFDFKTMKLPKFPVPEGESATEMFERLCRKGLSERYAADDARAQERLEYEMRVIEDMNFADYFLLVWDYVRFAKENGILVGPGRGSAVGSIVSYCLGITNVDPLRYNLLFERFLNPERITMPDIDIDFDYERRNEVISYVANRYGHDHVAQIVTFGTMAARGVIRDVGRVLDMSYQETDAVAKMVPMALDMTLDKALEISPDLKRAYENDERVARLIDIAKRLEGMPRHTSTHAAGVLITASPVSDYVPLQTNDDVVTTQFPMGTLEALQLLKMDFLGLRTLNVIGDTLAMVAEGGGEALTPEEIPLEDEAVYKMISEGDTDGVFQLEGGGMRQFLANMKPENFEDIIAAISLYRPGPMDSIPKYIEGKHNPESVEYAHPLLKPILDVTYGCMVYQEQVMQIVRDLAGYSYGRSDLVRRAMSKKKHDVMAQEEEYFIHGKPASETEEAVPGAVANGVPEEVAKKLFDEMTAFASYAFNKSHAAAYGVIAIQTAWLKRHHPTEFMAAMMNSITGNTVKVAFYIQYCRKNGIQILPPDINRSRDLFSVDRSGKEPAIRFGLSAVKNAGSGAVRDILRERDRGGVYKDLYDFADRAYAGSVNKKTVESLIAAGAFDSLPGNRRQKLFAFEKVMDSASKSRRDMIEGQVSLFDSFFGESAIQIETPPFPEMEDLSMREKLDMEKAMTGIYISGHPLDDYREALSCCEVNSRFLESLQEDESKSLESDGMPVAMGGLVLEKKMRATKSGSMMAILQLEDLYGVTEVLVFPRVCERCGNDIREGDAVLISGRLSVREEEAPKLLMDGIDPLPKELPKPKLRTAPRPAPQAEYAPDNRTLYLRIPSEDALEDVARVLMRTPGAIRVVAAVGDDKQRLELYRNLWVNDRFDKEKLNEILGEDSVVLK